MPVSKAPIGSVVKWRRRWGGTTQQPATRILRSKNNTPVTDRNLQTDSQSADGLATEPFVVSRALPPWPAPDYTNYMSSMLRQCSKAPASRNNAPCLP